MENTCVTSYFETPLGELVLGWKEDCLCLCDWADSPHLERHKCRTAPNECIPLFVLAQLEEYFYGERKEFAIPVGLSGTPFQQEVWGALRTIPYGETRSYQQIARQIGRPNAVRAVANAVAHNAVSIVIPCHRVVGSNGSLTGYAGGIDIKQNLLQMEAQQ